MKKFSALLLIFALMFSFAACKGGFGGETTTKRQYYKEEITNKIVFENPNLTVPEKLFSVVNVEDYDLKASDPNTTQSSGVTTLKKDYEIKKEAGKDISDKITSGSSEIIINKTFVKDLVSQGWQYSGKIKADSTADAGKEITLFMKNSEGKVLKFKAKNNTSATAVVGECVVIEVGIAKSIESIEYAEFKLGDSVKTDSTYETVVKSLGSPKRISVMEKYQGNELSFCKATLYYETSTYKATISYIDDGKTATVENFEVGVK